MTTTQKFVWVPVDAYTRYKRRSYGGYQCTSCQSPARTISNLDFECHTCRDWNGCGGDCTTVGAECTNPDCGAKEIWRTTK